MSAIVERSQYDVTPKEFRDDVLKPITDHLTNLLTLAHSVGRVADHGFIMVMGEDGKPKRKEHAIDVNGQVVGKREVGKFASALKREILELSKYLTEAKRRKKRAAGSSTGFKNPIFVSSDLVAFFKAAADAGRLGNAFTATQTGTKVVRGKSTPVYTYTSTGRNLGEAIPLLLNQGITSPGLLTALFSIYTTNAGIQLNNAKGQKGAFIQADPLMKQYFGGFWDQIRAGEQESLQKMYQKGETFKNGNPKVAMVNGQLVKLTNAKERSKQVPIEPFNENHFRYPSFQSLIKALRVNDSDWPTEAERAAAQAQLDDTAVRARLEGERTVVSNSNAAHKAQ